MTVDFGGMLWQVIALFIGVVGVFLFLLWEFWVTPPISRALRKAKWGKCPGISFIQMGGVVHLVTNQTELPEGVVMNKLGVAVRNIHPYIKEKAWKKLSSEERREVNMAMEVILNTPILAGLGKHVLFGSVESPLLGNLDTIAMVTPQPEPVELRNKAVKRKVQLLAKKVSPDYSLSLFRVANLAIFKEVLNMTTATRTQLDSLKSWVETRMLKKIGGDMVRLVVVALVMVGVIGALGLTFWFLTQS